MSGKTLTIHSFKKGRAMHQLSVTRWTVVATCVLAFAGATTVRADEYHFSDMKYEANADYEYRLELYVWYNTDPEPIPIGEPGGHAYVSEGQDEFTGLYIWSIDVGVVPMAPFADLFGLIMRKNLITQEEDYIGRLEYDTP